MPPAAARKETDGVDFPTFGAFAMTPLALTRFASAPRRRRALTSTAVAAVLAAASLSLAHSAPVGPAGGVAAAATAPAHAPGEATSGSLWLKTSDGYVEAVRLATDVKLSVSGPTVRGRIVQAFRNPTDHWVEAVYAFPLDDGGAVDMLKMVVGRRVILGEVRKKEEARAVYEAAKASGQKAALVEQQRPNLFTNAVANIGPGQTVVVQIEYQAPVRVADGVSSVRVPLVAAPRYTPAGHTPDAAAAAPVIDPRGGVTVNPTTVEVDLRPGFAPAEVTSPYHRVRIAPEGAAGRRVTLEGGPVAADRDFVLSWKPAAAAAPVATLFHEKVGGDDYLLAYLTPPTAAPRTAPPPRDVVFVIDNSGSMQGESMKEAKASLLYGLAHLRQGDRFDVVRFDDTLTDLFSDTVSADAEHLERARRFVAGLEAKGGTEMLPAMRAALTDRHAGDGERLRQVVFMTDGEISNEKELFGAIATDRGRSRVFMVGIGSAPNTFLMSRAADVGRGTFTHVGGTDEVEARMKALFDKLENPAATDLKASFTGTTADVGPAVMPDLYRGEPLVLSAKVLDMRGDLALDGQVDGRRWSLRLPLAQAVEGRGLGKVWARRKIEDAEAERTLGRVPDAQTDALVLSLGLEHHMVTSQTSLVAVDRAASRPADAPLTRSDVPLDLPAGWSFDGLFGGAPDSVASPTSATRTTAAGVDLPQTGTDSWLLMAFGALLAAAGALGRVFQSRRASAERAS